MGRSALARRLGGVLVVQTKAFLSIGRLCTSSPPVDAWALDGDLFLVADNTGRSYYFVGILCCLCLAIVPSIFGRPLERRNRHGDGAVPRNRMVGR